MIENRDFANLLAWVRNILEVLRHSVGNVLECAEMDAFVVTELVIAHIAVAWMIFRTCSGCESYSDSIPSQPRVIKSRRNQRTCFPMSTNPPFLFCPYLFLRI